VRRSTRQSFARERTISSFFASMVDTLSPCDVMHLIQDDDLSGVYLYSRDTRTARQLPCNDINWVVRFLLTRYNKRHILCKAPPKDLKSIGEALDSWATKIRWRAALGGGSDVGYWRLQSRKNKPAPYSGGTYDNMELLESYIATVSKNIFHECQRVLVKSHKQPREYSNVNKIASHAIYLLKIGTMGILPTDKDGGFALSPKDDILAERLSMLSGEWYTRVDYIDGCDIASDYLDTCRDVAKLLLPDSVEPEFGRQDVVHNPLYRALAHDVRHSGIKGIFSGFNLLVKTHKDDGDVVCRQIHTCHQSPLRPGMRWISETLRPGLLQLPFLVKNTRDLLDQVELARIDISDKFVKLDIKDYFMSGVHSDIVKASSELVGLETRPAFSMMLQCILRNQYIKLQDVDGTWKTSVGSGMGVPCSGEVSDAAFYCMVERDFIYPRSPRVQHVLKFYARFKDDALVILGGDLDQRCAFVEEYRARAAFFKIKVESVSTWSVTMLDVRLFKGRQWESTGVIDYTLHVKDTSVWVPLSAESAHPAHVHKSWPAGQIRRFRHLCSNSVDFETIVQSFYSQLQKSNGIDCRGAFDDYIRRKKPKSSTDNRIVIPYNPVWKNAKLGAILEQCSRQFNGRVCTGLSWSLGGRSVLDTVLSLNSEYHGQFRDLAVVRDIWL
jgi:hypothetical protein